MDLLNRPGGGRLLNMQALPENASANPVLVRRVRFRTVPKADAFGAVVDEAFASVPLNLPSRMEPQSHPQHLQQSMHASIAINIERMFRRTVQT